MSRSRLRTLYNIAVVVALAVGFGAGYMLKGPGGGATVKRAVEAGVTDRAFPGCRAKYTELKRAFAYGPYVRVDYADVLKDLRAALDKDPGYLPYHALQARIYEDWAVTASRPDATDADRQLIAQQLGLSADADAEATTRAAREKALQVWDKAGEYALVREVAEFGPLWRVIRDQHLSALKDRREFQVPTDESGVLDLTEVYNLHGITRDHDRYPNDLSTAEQGYSFEEKHMADVLYCPQHPSTPFEFPCVRYLPNEGDKTLREDVEFFRTVIGVDGQKLDIEDAEVKAIHLLCFNVTPDGRPVKAVAQVQYSGGREEAKRMLVGPWRQNDALLRDTAMRRQLDPAYRDSEMHKCNGEELEMANAPAYMYHVTVPLDPSARLDRISFPRYDPTTTGLEDPGIDDVRIVAVTLDRHTATATKAGS
jgi:hypothetical protein